ncbi:MAG: hypothetical protein WC831_06395 [Parcubacteria group bacterium]|jgi:hypothetical protein
MSVERPNENPKMLNFFYEGKKYSVPRVSSPAELLPFLHNRILPGLERLKKEKAAEIENLEIGLCFAWFVQEGEGFEDKDPAAANAIKEVLKNAGFKIPDIPYKANRFCTSRDSFLHRMRQNPEHYTDFDRIHILAPAYALAYTEDNFPDQLKNPEKYKIELSLNDGVAISYRDLMKGTNLQNKERLYFEEIVKVMDRLMNIKPIKN